MLELLERIADHGPPHNTDICHQIEDEIREFIKGRIRVFWFYDKGRVVVCTHGFVKRSRKTPRLQIDHADRIRRQYLEDQQRNEIHVEEDDDG